VRNIAEVTIAVANARPFAQDHRRRAWRDFAVRKTINRWSKQLRSFASK